MDLGWCYWDMLADTRKHKICKLLKEQSAVTTADLAKRFGVSIETIRKDLLHLERENELVRVHGGAVLKAAARPYWELAKRLDDKRSEKAEVSRLAAKFIQNGDIIAIDTGSTAIEFIEVLMEQFDTLTIVTHSMDVFQKARDFKNFHILLCGGYFLSHENSFYGSFAAEMLDKLHVSKVFVFPCAVSLSNGICDGQQQLTEMQKKLLTVGDQVFILADSSKYEKSALIKVADMNPSYIYLADSNLPDEVKKVYQNNNITIITEEDEIK